MTRFALLIACLGVPFLSPAQTPPAPVCDKARALEIYASLLDQLEVLECPSQTPPPPGDGFPTDATTGPRPGAQLVPCAAGPITTSRSGCLFSGAITIAAPNVTIADSVVAAPASASYAVWDGGSPQAGTVLRNVEVYGASGKCIYLQAGFLGEALDIHGCEDGIYGHSWTLTDSWVHDILTGGSRHSDGTQVGVTGKIVVRRNRIVVEKGAANSALFFQSNFGPVDDVLVEGNLLSGGTFTVYCDQKLSWPLPTRVRFRGNTFVRGSASFGIGNVPCKSAAGFEWSANKYPEGDVVPVP